MFKTEHKVGEFSANIGLTESLTSLDIVIVIIQATQIIQIIQRVHQENILLLTEDILKIF